MVWYAIAVTVLFVFVSVAFVALAHRGGYFRKLFVKLGWRNPKTTTNWAVFSWNNTMEKLDYQADIVFFGDSITRGSDFRKDFPNKKIVNLGYSGDTLAGMVGRVSMIKAMNPKQVFILGGINGLTNQNAVQCAKTYEKLLDAVKEALPETRIYVQSVLPLSSEKEKAICKNETIIFFNQRIRELAEARELPFIDLYSLYVKDGVMNPELTVDGIHLNPHAYGRWAALLEKYILNPKAETSDATV